MEESAELRKLWSGFWPSRVVLTANNFRVFDCLQEPKGAAFVAEKTGSDSRAMEILLDAVASLGLLVKENGQYRNGPLADKYLVSGKPDYMGDIIRHADGLWENWSHLDDVVRTGKPHKGERRDQRAFILGMHNLAVRKAPAVMDAVGLEGVRRAIDLGGGPGTYSLAMAKVGIEVTLFDLPETIAIARDTTAGSTVRLVEGDFLKDDIGSGYDLAFISQILHAFDPNQCQTIIRKAAASLNAGGRVAVQEFVLNDDHAGPPQGSLFSINMLVGTDGGRSYSSSEMKEWMTQAGLKVEKEVVVEEAVIIVGRK